jgi:hypothetical protein
VNNLDLGAFGNQDWMWWATAVAGAAILVWVLIVWQKGRPFSEGDVFRASRFSSGNHLFPTQVLISPANVVQYTPQWIGRREESIHMAHVSSVKINTGFLLSDVLIETSGGASPIRCHGHHKSDAVRMKTLIEQHQTAYYQTSGRPSPAEPGPVGPDTSRR